MKLSMKNNCPFKPIKFLKGHHSLSFVLLTGCLLFLLVACGKSSDKSTDKASSISSSKEKSDSKSSNNCLEPFYGKPENIFSKEMVAKYVDFQGSEVEYSTLAEKLKKPELPKGYLGIASVQAEWKINRQKHNVLLGSINKIKLYKSKTPVDRFYAKYHTRTPEEQAALTKALDKEVAKKTTDKNAKKITDGIGMNFSYLKVDGLGDAAVWEQKVNAIIVLVGDYQFTVHVGLNKGNDFDLEKAKLIAQAVIDKVCK